MKPIVQTCLHLLFLLSMTLPPVLVSGCGGDRYSCDNCEGDSSNPDESDSEDAAEILPLSFIEAADFTVGDVADIDNFDNYSNIDYRISTVTEARATEYDDEDTLANIAGISAEYWNDQIETLTWEATNSDLDDNKQRQYYLLEESGWVIYTTRNNHELRRYDERVYDFWLFNTEANSGTITIKWEIYEAKDRLNPNGVAYPSIAGKQMDDVLQREEFIPPIINDEIALQSSSLWGDDVEFSDTATAEAKIYVVYKQFRPITVEGDVDTAVETAGFVAFAPAPAITAGTAFAFQPFSAAIDPATFIDEFRGADSTARFQVNESLWISFSLTGTVGAGGDGAILWSSKTALFEDGYADYYEVTTTNGSYIRIDIPMDQKAAYKLETYENPLVAFVEDGVNDGAHPGWYYVPSGTLDEDDPQPHYAFNAAATSDLKTAFSNWRREQYCLDNDHDNDPGRATTCAGF